MLDSASVFIKQKPRAVGVMCIGEPIRSSPGIATSNELPRGRKQGGCISELWGLDTSISDSLPIPRYDLSRYHQAGGMQ